MVSIKQRKSVTSFKSQGDYYNFSNIKSTLCINSEPVNVFHPIINGYGNIVHFLIDPGSIFNYSLQVKKFELLICKVTFGLRIL